MPKPNILFLISDNQRLDTISLLNQTACRTPTWDRMAKEGILFENMHSTSPICSPSRASIFTGLQPHQAGMPCVAMAYAEKNDGTSGESATEINSPPISHYL